MNAGASVISTQNNAVVLVVEDEAGVRSFCCAVLRRSGYRVLEAPGPVEALYALEHAEEPVSLVLTDITMPVMNGKEMVKRIDPKQLPNLKVLYMSGYSENIEPGLDLLEKPFTSAALLRRVRDALDRSR
jgi:CheY-like chemotaxis protein